MVIKLGDYSTPLGQIGNRTNNQNLPHVPLNATYLGLLENP